MSHFPKAFSLGAPFLFIHESLAKQWLGATNDNSTEYEDLCQLIENITENDKLIETCISGFNLNIFLSSADFYQLTPHTFLQITAYPNDFQSLTDILNHIENTTEDYTNSFQTTVLSGKYYLFDAAWEFQEILHDDNYLSINFIQNQKITIKCNTYDNTYFIGDVYEILFAP